MTNYELPMKDGKVDIELAQEVAGMVLGMRKHTTSLGIALYVQGVMQAIDANARKDEREACAKLCSDLALGWSGSSAVSAHSISLMISERGEK